MSSSLTNPNDTLAALASLEREIGVKPDINALNVLPWHQIKSVKAWLVLSGLPKESVEKTKEDSLKNAYNIAAYRQKWIQNTQKKFDLNSILETETKPEIKPEAKPAPQNSALSDSEIERIATRVANKEINSSVPLLIKDSFQSFEIKLSESAKEQIKKLALETALDAIEKNKAPREIIVTNPLTQTRVNVGIQHEKFPELLKAAQAKLPSGFRLNIWLTGPAGSGKTTAAENVAKALNLPFASDGSLDADYKVLGYKDANGNFHSTEFLRVFENGGIYCADEIDNWQPSALLSLNSALANGFVSTPRGQIKRHADFICIACANTWGLGATNEYVGRTKLDAASLDRFQPKIDWPIDENLEAALSTNLQWTQTVQAARRAAKNQGLKILISPRATLSGAALLQAGFSVNEVKEMTFGAGLSSEQKRAIGIV